MARGPSRRSAAGGNFDSMIESRGNIDRKVAKKIKEAKEHANKVELPPEKAEFAFTTKTSNPAPKNRREWNAQIASEMGKKGSQSRSKLLTPMQAAYVENVVDKGLSPTAAAREAGYSVPDKTTGDMARLEKVENAIAERRKAYEEAAQISRKRVMEGLLEAVDMAKIKSDPLSMVAGWREIAKICGYYEPVKHQVDVNINGAGLLSQMRNMSEADLVRLAQAADDEAEIIEGEFTRHGDDPDKAPY